MATDLVLRAAGRTHIGQRRHENQDAIAYDTARGLFIVVDGMGGHPGGAQASAVIVDALPGAIDGPGDVDERVGAALQAANQAVRAAGDRKPHLRGMGAAAVAVLVDVATARIGIAHVGDCRAHRIRDGRLEQLTEDHTLVQELVRSGRLHPTAVARHPDRHILTRAVGTESDVRVTTRREPLESGDVLLLSSDGIHGCIEPEELAEAAADDPADACAALVDLGNARGGVDNLSVVIVRAE